MRSPRQLSHFSALALLSEVSLEALWHSFQLKHTHIHTSLSKHGQNRTQSRPSPLRICPKVWLKVFYKLSCFCLASAVVPEDMQLINVPSQTEARLRAVHEWLQPEHLGCSNSILWVFGAQRSGTMLEEDPYFCLLNELHLRASFIVFGVGTGKGKEGCHKLAF